MSLIREIEDYFKRRNLIAAVVHRPDSNVIEVTYNGNTLRMIDRKIIPESELYDALDNFVEANLG